MSEGFRDTALSWLLPWLYYGGKPCCPVQDRVEASPEQLASAMAAAEKLTEQSGMRVRVIGWYHSHPHITVLPSHVDVATQASYQQLDAGFIGIIFSTFNQVRAPGAQCFIQAHMQMSTLNTYADASTSKQCQG